MKTTQKCRPTFPLRAILTSLLLLLTGSMLMCACSPDSTQKDPPGAPDTPEQNDATEATGGLYVPTATPQREQYVAHTAAGYEDGPYLIETVYVTEQTVIADLIATLPPYGADPTGKTDSTAAIQKALDACAARGGGTVFLPVGQYLVTDTLHVPAGVVLQGDWQDPDLTETPEYGTLILAKTPTLTDSELFDPTAKPLFELLNDGDANNGLIGLTVFYPEQDINDVKPYGYTVYGGRPRMVMLRDLTLINAYRGIGACLGSEGTHELLQLENVRMTVLSMGYKASLSREIGYTVDLRISPRYWSEASGSYACADAAALRDYCRAHTVGMEFTALDLNQYTDLYIESCHTALRSQSGFWGAFYGLQVKDCVYGMVAQGLNSANGILIANATIEADAYAVVNYAVASGAIKLSDVQTTGKGGIAAVPGAKIVVDNSDDLSAYQPTYGSYVKPAAQLYVVDVKGLSQKKKDAAPAIQAALDAAAATGGVVYLPQGVYSLYTPLNVPSGVELRGASQIAIRDRCANGGAIYGTAMLCYVSEGDFITLNAHAGVQGIRIYYPAYDASTALELLRAGDDVTQGCVAIRGKGAGVYAANTVVSGSFIGIDFTGCDDHLIKQCFGCSFTSFIRAGGKNGHIESVLCNQTYTMRHPFYVRGMYDPNHHNSDNWKIHSNEGNDEGVAILRDLVLHGYCDTVHLIDAEQEELNNVFMYGCRRILRTDNASAVGYNVTTDWQSGSSMFLIENGSDVVSFNPLRTSGKSHECDASSSLRLYNRIINGQYLEPNYDSACGLADNTAGEAYEVIGLFDCDSLDGVKYATLNKDADYIMSGDASLKQGDNPGTVFEVRFDPVDASEFEPEELYLHMWVWIEDVNSLVWSSGNLITLSNFDGGSEYAWNVTSFVNSPGWNELWLPLTSGYKVASELNLSSLRYAKMTLSHSALARYPDVYVDDISLCAIVPHEDVAFLRTDPPADYSEPSLPVDQAASRVMIDDCETTDFISPRFKAFASVNTDPDFIKEGDASIRLKPSSLEYLEMIFPATDASPYAKHGYLHMWVYVDDITNLGVGGQIELTSSGKCDVAEKNWTTTAHIKQSGWNELWLPLHEANAGASSTFNAARVDYIRIYAPVGKRPPVLYIDDVYICNVIGGEYDESNTEPVGNAFSKEDTLPVLCSCDHAGSATGVTLNTLSEYVKEGAASFASAPATVRLVLNVEDCDVTPYMNGYLHLWVYIENPNDLRGGQFELTSGATCDVEEINWQVKSYLTRSGWNEVFLPLAAPNSDNGFDPTRMNYFRMYTQMQDGKQDHTVYIDDIRFVTEK